MSAIGIERHHRSWVLQWLLASSLIGLTEIAQLAGVIIIVKNFNRRSCHGHHGSKSRSISTTKQVHVVSVKLATTVGHVLHELDFENICGLTSLLFLFSFISSLAHNTHTHVNRTHSLTHLHQHSYNHVVLKRQLSYYRIWNRIFTLKVAEGGEQIGVPGENPRQPVW